MTVRQVVTQRGRQGGIRKCQGVSKQKAGAGGNDAQQCVSERKMMSSFPAERKFITSLVLHQQFRRGKNLGIVDPENSGPATQSFGVLSVWGKVGRQPGLAFCNRPRSLPKRFFLRKSFATRTQILLCPLPETPSKATGGRARARLYARCIKKEKLLYII